MPLPPGRQQPALRAAARAQTLRCTAAPQGQGPIAIAAATNAACCPAAAELVADCKKCCVKDLAERKFTSAVLEVCPYRWVGGWAQQPAAAALLGAWAWVVGAGSKAAVVAAKRI